jgi:peptidoglycan/LPS O-acetylase OafA/YrhL
MRLLNFACVALLVRAAWRQLAPLIAKRPLTILGEASLGVFAYHVFVVYFMAWRYPNGSPWLVLAALVGVWPVAVGWLAFRKLRRAAGLKI